MCVLLFSCSKPQTLADTIVSAKKIYICNDAFDIAECVAITDGKIVAYGSQDEIDAQYEAKNNIKTSGIVYPGMVDAHSHFYGYGLTLNKVDLTNTMSLDDVISKTVSFAKSSPEYWVTGRGWDQTDWTALGTLTNSRLNAYFPDRPVFIKRIDGHAGLANAKALELAGIDTNTSVAGGEIEIANGRLTGIITDNAMSLIDNIIPKPSRSSEISALLKAEKNCFDAGLTTVTDAGLDLNTILLIDSLQKAGALSIRVYAMCNPTEENFNYFTKNGPLVTDKLRVSSFKIYADGSLGSRGAKLKESYCDHENYTGIWVTEPEEMDRLYNRISQLHFQANTHCIGDSANKKVLELYGKYLVGKNDKRWRIEHAQVVTPSDRSLFAQYSIIPSVQPTHATSDMHWADDRLCATRLEGAYAYNSLLALNGWIPLGTDFPVEHISPIQTFFAAVYRQDKRYKPMEGFLKEEALSKKDALLGITLWAAKGNRMEESTGSLEPGKLADFVIFDKDLMIEKDVFSYQNMGTYLEGRTTNR